MEKFTSVQKVVGNISDKNKKDLLKESGDIFEDQEYEELKKEEKKKK